MCNRLHNLRKGFDTFIAHKCPKGCKRLQNIR